MMHWFTPAWIVQTLIASGLLMALVMAVRGPVMRMFGAKIAYALWLLPALRMVLPPLPGHHTLMIPVASLKPHEATLGLADPATAAAMVATPALPHPAPELVVQYAPMDPPPVELHAAGPLPLPPAPPAHAIDWAMVLLAIWLVGAVVVFVTQLVRYRLFLNRALKGSVPLARECGIDVLISDTISGPIAAGIFKRRILLPGNFVSRYSSEERRLALRHEAAHHDRWDIPANLLALAVTALHWWNPLAHRAYRAFRADQELACDATVLRDATATERHSYGSAMLKSASGRMPAMACALSHKEQLKKRILMMANAKFGPVRLITGAALAATAIGGGLVLTATGQAQAPTKAVIETVPVPPSVPMPPAPPMRGVPPVPPAPPAPPAHIAMAAPPAPPAPPQIVHDDREAARKAEECARREAEKAREAGRRAAEAARDAGRQAAEAARKAARDAGREAALAAREAARQSAEASREAGRQAALAARQAAEYSRHSADYSRQAAEAQRMAMADLPNTAELVRTSMEAAKAGMRAACDAQGIKMSAKADLGALATCGNHIHEVVLASLRQARAEVAGDRSIPEQARQQALSGIDAAIASNSARR